MKSYTDLEQSNKLADILPLESADMCFINNKPQLGFLCEEYHEFGDTILQDYYPCWSLAALLNVLPSATLDSSDDRYYRVHCMGRYTEWYDNPVDACVEMIVKLDEANLL